MKTCLVCGQEKPADQFTVGWRKCLPCYAAYKRERYAASPERARDKYNKARATPERIAYQRAAVTSWYERNRETVNAQRRAAYAANRETRLAKMRASYAANPAPSFERVWRRRARKANAPRVEHIYRSVLIKRDGLRCYLCGSDLAKSEITIDHVMPLSRGGTHTYDNVRIACKPCNLKKWALTLGEYINRYGPLLS